MEHFYIICFDIFNKKRLRQVAIQMENYGQRIQYSVFECHLNEENLNKLKQQLKQIIEPTKDHIRYYHLCPKDHKKILLDGKGVLTPNHDYHLH